MPNLNNGGVTITDYGSDNQILFDANHFLAVPIILSGSGEVLAGTPITGNLTTRDTAMTVAGASDTPVGILLGGRTAATGGVNATLLVHGAVNINRLATATQALITADVIAALPGIAFLKG